MLYFTFILFLAWVLPSVPGLGFGDETTLEPNETSTESYLCNTTIINETWISPANWTGSDPILYISFDYPDCLIMMEGTQQIHTVPLGSGKVM